MSQRIVVIGAGMSGLLCGMKLRAAGYDDVRIYEKAQRAGGTWRDNRYPGLSCDVPSQHYCYSFALNPEWTSAYPSRAEIHAYLEDTAARFGALELVQFGKELARAEWVDGCWRLAFTDGSADAADTLIAATGVLHHPVLPAIEGVGAFAGPAFHTAGWPDGIDLAGQRVGIIGTGSTAIQMMPAVVDEVREIKLFQRSPQWILPIEDTPFTEAEKAEFRARPELLEAAYDGWNARIRKGIARAVVGDEERLQKIADACREHLETKVRDPEMRARLTPDYKVACKRLVMSEHFYDAIQRPNAELVTNGIECIESQGIRTTDGVLHELDVLVYATGFDATAYMRPIELIGPGGYSLEQAWSEATIAHRGVTIPGFPNFFMMLGPNSPIGNFSLIMVAEHQIDYIQQLMRQANGGAVAPKPEACARFNAEVRAAMQNTVWVSGCTSWYLDKHGHPVVWPWSLERFQDDMAAPDPGEFEWRQITTGEEISS
ncbi:MAG: NAD(P)/FAD-dependent oxidoreductase [Salinisphaera sp.]|nr:NAD(P)/FAD-dependent oxidoreductase [Salinisphaera sp.]